MATSGSCTFVCLSMQSYQLHSLQPCRIMPSLPHSPSSFIAPGSARLGGATNRAGATVKGKRNTVLVYAESNANRDRPDADANVILRLAWYGAEALGNVVAAFTPKTVDSSSDAADSVQGPITRENVVQAVKTDYEKAYFVTGNVSTGVYEEDCEFADPAGSFKSLKRFKNNCSNFGSLLEKSDVKLTKSEEFKDKFVAFWRFSCVLKFPWRPILSSTGYTEYYFDSESGKICRHVENWDVPKMALLGQVFKPNPGLGRRVE